MILVKGRQTTYIFDTVCYELADNTPLVGYRFVLQELLLDFRDGRFIFGLRMLLEHIGKTFCTVCEVFACGQSNNWNNGQ